MMGTLQDGFGWTADRFWSATPVEVWSMIDARIEANKRQ